MRSGSAAPPWAPPPRGRRPPVGAAAEGRTSVGVWRSDITVFDSMKGALYDTTIF
jgi:hypothetical protein